MPTFKKNKNLKGKFTSSQIHRAVKDVLNRGMGIREAGRMHNIHNPGNIGLLAGYCFSIVQYRLYRYRKKISKLYWTNIVLESYFCIN